MLSDHQPSPSFLLLSHVVDIDLKFAGADTYGEVLSGRLKIRTNPLIGCKFGNRVSNINMDGRMSRATFLNGRAVTCSIHSDMKPGEPDDGLWYFLPIEAKRRYGDGNTDPGEPLSGWKQVLEPIIRGLMLEQVDGSPHGRFRRVGCFWDWRNDDLVSAMDDQECWADESLYESAAGTLVPGRPQYYISII
jgi:hypothetical protein